MVRLLTLLLIVLFSVAPSRAQAPDCSGVSGVFNTDPDLLGELKTVRVALGLSVPVFVTQAPGDPERLFVVEQVGRIKILEAGAVLPFLDFSALVKCCDEEGFLGLAFHPDYATNRFFFVYHTTLSGDNVIARYQRDPTNPDLADPGSRVEVLTIPHPGAVNHNGGMLAFGPQDGRLYVSVGDGGGGCDPGPDVGNGQSLTTNLGKILRLDVDTLPYATDGNPFHGAVAGNDEIWSYGLRNPWRFSFDRITGAIYIGDVGQVIWEEVDCGLASSTGGENYGWVNYEGDHCPNPSCGPTSCAIADYVPPIREYNQVETPACVVIGGYVYRGCRMADLRGTYFYADACEGWVKTFRTDGGCSASPEPDPNRRDDLEPGGGHLIDGIVAFGEDGQGELYLVDYAFEIYKILPTLSIMEVSGSSGGNPGPFALLEFQDDRFVWEDFEAASGHPNVDYKVYRAIGDPTGPFLCVNRGPDAFFDPPDLPGPGQIFYYLVTAADATGEETVAGPRSDGALRSVDTGSACPR